MSEKETFLAKCEAHGEAGVREYLAEKRYGEARAAWARRWLENKAHERALSSESRRESSQAEQIDIARSAKDAAWEAANAARDAAKEAKAANVIATAALIAAVIAIAVSILNAFLGSS